MLGILVSLCVTLFEAICVVTFFDIFMHRRHSHYKLPETVALIVILVVATSVVSYFLHDLQSIREELIKGVLLVGIFMLLSLVFYQRSFPISILLSTIIYFLLVVTDYVGLIITDAISGTANMMFNASPAQRSALAIAYKIGLFLLLMVIRVVCQKLRLGIYRQQAKALNSWWILFLLMPILSIASIVSVVNVAQPEDYSNPLLLSVALGWLGLTVAMFILLQVLSNREAEHQAVEIIAEHTDTEMESIKTISQINEDFHDYQNHLIWIDKLLSDGNIAEAQRYIRQFPGKDMMSMPRIHTNNPVIDAIVNQKYWTAKSKSIAILPTMNDLSSLPIDAKDLVAIVSNLLDNAIEACENVTDSPVIQLKIVREECALVLSVKNPVAKNVQVMNNNVVTSKAEKQRHGYGLMSVKKSLERYDAAYIFHCEDMHFLCSAVIPLEEKITA